MASLSLLHTADMHNRLTGAAAQRLGELRERNEALLLDSGDAIAAANVSVRRREPTIELMNEAGYTAMAAGNREYFFRKRGMIHKTRMAQFAVLSANLQPLRGDMGHIRPWIVIAAPGGARVGFFGLTRIMIPPGSWLEAFSDMRFVPWHEAVRAVVSALRQQADWVVALTHLGDEYDRQLIEAFPEIDVVLAGHSHPRATRVEQVHGRLVCWSAPCAREAALVRITKTEEGNRYESSVIALP